MYLLFIAGYFYFVQLIVVVLLFTGGKYTHKKHLLRDLFPFVHPMKLAIVALYKTGCYMIEDFKNLK